MATLWNLALEDQQKMRQFQQRISDIDHWKNDPFEVIRFYKEYKGNLNKAEKIFRSMIQWRIEDDVDNILETHGEPDPLWHQYPIGVLNSMDKDGDPIYLDRAGVSDSVGLLQHFGVDAMKDYIVYTRELHERREFWKPYEDKVGHRVRNMTVLFDLDGIDTSVVRLIPLVKKTSRIVQDCYAGWGKVSKGKRRVQG